MICKTEGIVLRTLKHQDANLITTVYTRDYGLRSFLIKGYRSTRARRQHSYFQPLSIVELVFWHKDQRNLQKVSESKVAYLLQEAQTHPIKLSLGLAILEIFSDTVKEELSNPDQYQFLRETIIKLDQAPKRLIQLFIHFLVHHTRFLGFFPHDASEGAHYVSFDVKQATFKAAPDNQDAIAAYLRRFVYSNLSPLPDPQSCQQITFDGTTKRILIKSLFTYYQTHIHGFRYPQTMRVFAEVFGQNGI